MTSQDFFLLSWGQAKAENLQKKLPDNWKAELGFLTSSVSGVWSHMAMVVLRQENQVGEGAGGGGGMHLSERQYKQSVSGTWLSKMWTEQGSNLQQGNQIIKINLF